MENDPSSETRWLIRGLRSLFEGKRHCDIDVLVGKESFSCHKVVLSAASKYFDVMFSSDMQESKAESVRLNDIDGHTFENLLRFIYTGSDVLTPDNVENMLHAACLLQIGHLQHHCERFLVEQISPENVIGFWSIATALNCLNLRNSSWEFILSNFEDIVQYDEFLKLDCTDLLTIIADDNLDIRNEETVCSAALRWVKERESERNAAFIDILSTLKLSQISLNYLLQNIYSLPTIHTNPDCMQILKDAVKYHALPEKRHMYSYRDVSLRNTSELSSLYVILGRRDTTDTCSSGSTDVLAFDTRRKHWYVFCPLPLDLGDEFATCPYGNDIYVSGGTAKPESFMKFSSKQCKWLEKAGLCVGRYRHCMVAMKDSIYCLGGYNCGTLASIEEFDISANTWHTVGKLKYAVDSASAVVHGDDVLVIGGWEGFADETSAVQSFNTSTMMCTVIGHLPSPQKDCRALSFNDRIYIVYSTGEIIQYDGKQSFKQITKIDDFHRKNFGLLKTERTLFVIGGSMVVEGKLDDSVTISSEVLAFPQESNTDSQCSIQGPLPTGFEVYGCYHILVKNKYPLVEFSKQFAW